MLYHFYDHYDIDDSAIGCGRIIQVDCDGLHTYVNPCDLINECVAHIPVQLTKPCVVDFLNTTIDSIPAGYFLRVNGSHCLEAVPLAINDTDELVKVSQTDTAGYLGAKIVGGTSGGWTINVSTIGSMGNQQVKIDMTAPSGVLTCDDLPSCDGAILRGDTNGSTYRDCGSSGDDGYRAERYTTSDIIMTTPVLVANRYKAYIFTNTLVWNGTHLQSAGNMDAFRGNPDMKGVGSYDGMIRIPKSGMYDVRMKGECVVNRGVSRIRLFLIQPASSNSKVLIDAKFGMEDGIDSSIVPIPYEYVSGGTTLGIESQTITLTGHNLLYFTAGEYVSLGCKVDTRDTSSYAPYVMWRRTVYDLYDQNPGQGVSEVSNIGPGLTMGVKRFSPHSYSFTY